MKLDEIGSIQLEQCFSPDLESLNQLTFTNPLFHFVHYPATRMETLLHSQHKIISFHSILPNSISFHYASDTQTKHRA